MSENDEEPRCERIVRDYDAAGTNHSITYVLEPGLGIPFGRNRAAREAIERGADLLAFVDDDEVVAQDWLTEIVKAYRHSGAVLLGGPLRVRKTERTLSPLQALMEKCIARRYARKEERAARRAGLNGSAQVTIVTNNWLAETAIFKEHDIWFDENMRFSGGTDAKLYSAVTAAGLRTAWAKNAIVYEEIPSERLSITYQYRRGRDQASTNYSRKTQGLRPALLTLVVLVPAKAVSVVLLVGALPFTSGRTLLDAVRATGWIVGRLNALSGKRSELYASVTGE